jgi:hypothetical protein
LGNVLKKGRIHLLEDCVELLASGKRKKHGLSWKSSCTVFTGGFSTLVK